MDSQPTPTWIQDPTAPTDKWTRRIEYCVYGYICQYEGSNDYCWQARRGGHVLTGIVEGRDAAMAAADDTLALPVEKFNARVAVELRAQMKQLEKDLLALQPDADLLPGYHAGFEAGAASVRQQIAAVLNLGEA